MHIEMLVEDSSGTCLIQHLLPKIIGPQNEPHTWRLHPYKGIGQIPKAKEMCPKSDPAKRALLNQLPRLLAGYGKTPNIDAVVVVVDTDNRDCTAFLNELKAVLTACKPAPTALFRLAIEEIESWYLGDRKALLQAYPKAKAQILNGYQQDSVCGTWELLADAIYPGGAKSIKAKGWPLPGKIKHKWAETIGPRMSIDENVSPSFKKFRDGIRRLVT